MRDALPYEMDAIDALISGVSPGAFASLGDETPISRKLSMLIRPTLVPAAGNAFVWGDWEQIEARVLPWLADSPGGEARLDVFREVDADPSIPDLYTRTAADLSGLPTDQIDKPLRQRGKVTELACGYGGGVNALHAMAANYGMRLDDELARTTVYKWREVNTWATTLWDALFTAVRNAMEAPGTTFTVGRVSYVYLADYLGGTLLCRLPSGRMLTYRRIKWERIDEEDDDGNVIDSQWHLTYARGWGRVKLWHGILAENCVAGDTLVATDRGWVPLVEVTRNDRVWDGEAFVHHNGIAYSGNQYTVPVAGVQMTPEHRVLSRHGWVEAQDFDRSDRATVRLPDGYPARSTAGAARCTSRPVYDILDAGPRSRFVVLSDDGPLIVHNCTQAASACVLRGTLVRLKPWPIKAHTHDEILAEIAVHAAEDTSRMLVAVMEQGFEWSAGLPLKAEGTIAYSYTKCEDAWGL